MDALGPEAIRFSSTPSLGGRADVVEVVRQPSGEAEVRLFRLVGHWRTRWTLQGTRRFTLPPADYLRLAAQVDAALADYRPPVPDPDNGEFIICTDGPGFLTERIRDGRIVTLSGQCPALVDEPHSNRRIAASLDALLCRNASLALRRSPFERKRCRRP